MQLDLPCNATLKFNVGQFQGNECGGSVTVPSGMIASVIREQERIPDFESILFNPYPGPNSNSGDDFYVDLKMGKPYWLIRGTKIHLVNHVGKLVCWERKVREEES